MMQLYHAQHAAAVWAAELEALRWIDWRVADERRATRRFGLHVERLALELLLERGHTVAMAARNDHHDLVANGLRVEVKAARFACPRESGGATRRLSLQHAPESGRPLPADLLFPS